MHDPAIGDRYGFKRTDLVAIKIRLERALMGSSLSMRENNFELYWGYMKKYVQAKLSRKELEQFARKLLGEDNLYLHNLFIQALLTNARSSQLPELSQTYTRPTDKKKPIAANGSNYASSSNVNSNKKQPNANKKNRVVPPGSSSKISHLQRSQDKVGQPPLRSSKGISQKKVPSAAPPLGPEYNVLRAKLQKIATEAGLSGITQDAIQLMMQATETYIKQILINTKPVPRSATKPRGLSINDFYRTAVLHPSLLGEDFLLHQEHLSLTLM